MNNTIQKKFKPELTIFDFYESADITSNREKHYSSRRQPEMEFANIVIHNCQNQTWWYKDFVGIECFVELRFSRYTFGTYLKEAVIIYLNNTRVLRGKTIDAKDFTII